ncbi:hypothetical protein BVX97_03085 [bacterium E08(2017)]|nr:hypothetical protein BVX97_03085 [bacterium E08(2017)]
MIFYQDEGYQREDSKIVAHIKGEFFDLCDDEVLVDSSNIDEIARAVEMFIQEEMDCTCVNTNELILLASRAMASVGDGHMARRFLLFGSGMIRPSEWEVTSDNTMWVLDLKQITLSKESALELTFFNAINILLDSIADVWDDTKGEGVLGLRHVCTAATLLLGSSARNKDRSLLINEIMAVCELKMQQIADRRGWDDEPRIMNLDLV